MDKFNDLLKQLQGLNIKQKSIDWAESLPDEIWSNHFENNFKELASGLDIDQRRHCEYSTSVIEIYGGILGISHITTLYSEMSSVGDFFYTMEFFEMKPTVKTTYIRND